MDFRVSTKDVEVLKRCPRRLDEDGSGLTSWAAAVVGLLHMWEAVCARAARMYRVLVRKYTRHRELEGYLL